MSVTGHDTLKTRRSLNIDGKLYDYFSLDAAAQAAGLGDISRLPFSLKVLLENLVRLENGRRRLAPGSPTRAQTERSRFARRAC